MTLDINNIYPLLSDPKRYIKGFSAYLEGACHALYAARLRSPLDHAVSLDCRSCFYADGLPRAAWREMPSGPTLAQYPAPFSPASYPSSPPFFPLPLPAYTSTSSHISHTP